MSRAPAAAHGGATARDLPGSPASGRRLVAMFAGQRDVMRIGLLLAALSGGRR